MRTVIGAVCLAGTAIILQGCGGSGGGGSPTKCLSPAIDLVTGQSKSTSTLTGKATYKTLEVPLAGTVTMTTKLDLDKFTAYLEQTSEGGMSAGSPMGSAQAKMILDSSKKILVVWGKAAAKVPQPRDIGPNCTIVTIPEADVLKKKWTEIIRPAMQAMFKCGGNDGTHDSWKLDFQHKAGDPTPTIPGLPPIPQAMGASIALTMKMDKDHVMKSMTTEISGSDLGPLTKFDETSTTDFTDSSTDGPAAADLDYSSWGTCTPPHDQDKFLSELQDFQKDGKNTIANLLIATVQASMKSQTKEIVV